MLKYIREWIRDYNAATTEFHKMGYFRAKVCDLMMFVDILKRKHKIW